MVVIALGVLIAIIVILWLRRRRKGQESGYVMQRGVFDRSTPAPAGGPLVSPTPPPPMPPPPPPGDSAPPPPTPPPADGTPPPPPGGHPPPPPYPWPPFGYGYPVTYYYDPFPRTYIIDEGASRTASDCYKQVLLNTEAGPKETCLSKTQYIEYLKNRIRGLEGAYDSAMSDLLFGRAWKISQLIKRAEKSLAYELGY